MAGTILLGCDHDVSLSGLTGEGAYLNAATVTYTLSTTTGTVLASGSLAYIAASNGNYAGVIESSALAGLTEGAKYHLDYTASQGGFDHAWRLDLWAARDGG